MNNKFEFWILVRVRKRFWLMTLRVDERSFSSRSKLWRRNWRRGRIESMGLNWLRRSCRVLRRRREGICWGWGRFRVRLIGIWKRRLYWVLLRLWRGWVSCYGWYYLVFNVYLICYVFMVFSRLKFKREYFR